MAATRLPPAVLAGHVMLAGGGLLVWIGYLILDSDRLAWTAVAALGLAATLGLVMAVRWLGVYRGRTSSHQSSPARAASAPGQRGEPERPGCGARAGRRSRPARAQLPAAGRHRARRLRCRDDHAGAAHCARRRRQLIASVRSPAPIMLPAPPQARGPSRAPAARLASPAARRAGRCRRRSRSPAAAARRCSCSPW